MPCKMATGSQVRLEEQDGEDYGVADGEGNGAAEPPVPQGPQLRGWLDGATSGAAGGPSAAMLTRLCDEGSRLLTTASASRRPTAICSVSAILRNPCVPLDHRPLDFDRATQRVDRTGR